MSTSIDSVSERSMAIEVTEAAAERIRQKLMRQGFESGGIRLGVKGGGCSGLNYVIRFEAESRPGDKVFERYGARIFVDLKSLLYLKGTTLDWSESLMQQGFTFSNPNAKNTCSCGVSFTV
jgi:iron-sulfur cluster assembly protein